MAEGKVKYLLVGFGFIAIIAAFLLVAFGGENSSANNDSTSQVFSKEDQDRPKAILSATKIDWKEIKLQDTVESEVELRNEGNSPLEISRLSTSCGCTSVKAILADGKETKEYSMHKKSEKVTILPKTAAKLKIIYRPYTMPVEGPVTREVFIETNDPNNKTLQVDVSAVVKK